MVTYLIWETLPDVNDSRMAVVGGINTPLQLAVFTLGFMEIQEADLDVVFIWLVIGWIIRKVCASLFPIYFELTLFYSVYKSIKPHFHGFGYFMLDVLIGNSYRCGVFGNGRLWPVYLNQRRKKASSSVSAAKDMMLQRILQTTWMMQLRRWV